MNRMAMESLARKHWAKWLPEKVAQLKANFELNEAIQGAATAANREIEDLMAQGYQHHEAEEVALPMFILLKPEPDAIEEPWERRELASWPRGKGSTARRWRRTPTTRSAAAAPASSWGAGIRRPARQ